MLFYTVLIVVSLVLAAVIALLYFMFFSAGTVVYSTVLPSTFNVSEGKLKADPKHTRGLDTVISRGLMTNETRGILAWAGGVQSKAVNQNIGDKANFTPRKTYSAPAQAEVQPQGRLPLREYRSTAAGKVYKVTRRPKPENHRPNTF